MHQCRLVLTFVVQRSEDHASSAPLVQSPRLGVLTAAQRGLTLTKKEPQPPDIRQEVLTNGQTYLFFSHGRAATFAASSNPSSACQLDSRPQITFARYSSKLALHL